MPVGGAKRRIDLLLAILVVALFIFSGFYLSSSNQYNNLNGTQTYSHPVLHGTGQKNSTPIADEPTSFAIENTKVFNARSVQSLINIGGDDVHTEAGASNSSVISDLSGTSYASDPVITFNVTNLQPAEKWNLIVFQGNTPGYTPLVALVLKSESYVFYGNSSSSVITLNLPFGLYYYFFGPLSTFAGPYSFSVSSSSQSINLSLPKTNNITMQIKNSVPGTMNNVLICSAYASSIEYCYYNVSNNNEMKAYLPQNLFRLYAGPLGTFITEPGLDLNSSVAINIVYPALYHVHISRSQLPSNFSYMVEAFSVNESAIFLNITNSSVMNGYLPNNTYDYDAIISNSVICKTGQFTVNGSAADTAINFGSIYIATFTETGLVSGSTWSLSVSLNSTITETTDHTSLSMAVNNNTFEYSAKFCLYQTGSQTFEVSGNSVSVTIHFPEFYLVKLVANNLIKNIGWQVSIIFNGGCYFYMQQSSILYLNLSNGTYIYQASEYNYNLPSDTFGVSGSNETINIVFPYLYKVTFKASNLPVSSVWTVSIFNSSNYLYQTLSSSGISILTILTNGTYYYEYSLSVRGTDIASVQHEFNVAGKTLSIDIEMPLLYRVSFREECLPSSTFWRIQVSNLYGNITYGNCTTHTNMTSYLPNGTFNYTASISYYKKNVTEFNVTGIETVLVIFPRSYAITFLSVNLVIGACWSVHAYSSTGQFLISNFTYGTCLNLFLMNGSYNYTYYAYGYREGPNPVIVDGHNETITLNFPQFYLITFEENALISGMQWQLSIYSANISKYCFSTTSQITFFLTNGTYSYDAQSCRQSIMGKEFNVSGSNRVILVPFKKQYELYFNEKGFGLSQGYWYVRLLINEQSYEHLSRTGTVGFCATNGTYNFTVGYTPFARGIYYSIIPDKGSITVDGANVTTTIYFTREYLLTFSETGLSATSNWTSNGDILKNTMEYNTYPPSTFINPLLSINSSGMLMMGPDGYYQTTGIQYNHSISSPVNVWINATAISGTSAPVEIILQNSNLSNYLFVAEDACVANSPFYGTYYGSTGSGGTSDSSGLLYSTPEFGAVYTYELSINSTGYGSINIYQNGKLIASESSLYVGSGPFYLTLGEKIGAPNTGPIPTSAVWESASIYNSATGSELYHVNFSKPVWSVDFNSTTYGSIVNTISIYSPNGTYNYHISTIEKGYSAKTLTGTITLDGSSLIVNVSFVSVYRVTFTEMGLPDSVGWYVNISGITGSGLISGNTYNTYLQNGVYTLTISASSSSYRAVYNGTLTVDGSGLNMSVDFVLVTYSVTFSEKGLPAGTAWVVNITGVGAFNTTNTSITVELSNGTYKYTASVTSGSYAQNSSTFTVSGNSMSIQISFIHTSQISISSTTLEEVAGGVAAAAIVGIAVALIKRKKP